MRSGFAEHVTAVGTLGGALDGTPAKRKRSTAKQADPNSAVSTAVRCECGDQFEDFRTAWLHVYQGHCEVLTNVGELRKEDGTRLVAICGTVGGYRRHYTQGSQVCDSCRAAVREREREYRADPEYRGRKREHQRVYASKRRNDPEWLERRREYTRAYRERKRGEQKVVAAPQTHGAQGKQVE